MSLNNFIPNIWAAELLINLYKKHVFTQDNVVNRDYEGDIANVGDTVRISAVGPVTVRDYVKNTPIVAPDALTDAQTTLTIEKSKYFNFAVDDVDKAQQKPQVMSAGMREAAYAWSDGADTYVAGLMVAAVAAANQLNAGAAITLAAVGDLYDNCVKLLVKLDEANVPADGRWIIMPPWMRGLIQRDTRFAVTGWPVQADDIRATGKIAMVGGADILISNNIPLNSTNYQIVAGHPMATSFAEQITEVEAYRPPTLFADAVRGLYLYGGKVIRPQALALGIVTKPTLAN